MEFKYSVGDTIYLKPYNQVKYHLGILQRTCEFISKVPLTIIHIPQICLLKIEYYQILLI